MAIRKKKFYPEVVKKAIYLEGKRIIEESVTKEIEEEKVQKERTELLSVFYDNLDKITDKIFTKLEKRGITLENITETNNPVEEVAEEIQHQIEDELSKL